MKRAAAAILSCLLAVIAGAADTPVYMRVGFVFRAVAPSTSPGGCTFGTSPDVIYRDAAIPSTAARFYKCVDDIGGDYYDSYPMSAATVSVIDAGGDTTTFPLLGTSATGSLEPATDSGLAYNATSNNLTVDGGVNLGTAGSIDATSIVTVTANKANTSGDAIVLRNSVSLTNSSATWFAYDRWSSTAGAYRRTLALLANNPADSSASRLRFGFDASNYLQLSVSSAGVTALTVAGSGPSLSLPAFNATGLLTASAGVSIPTGGLDVTGTTTLNTGPTISGDIARGSMTHATKAWSNWTVPAQAGGTPGATNMFAGGSGYNFSGCIGGSNPGTACPNGNSDCTGGGTCQTWLDSIYGVGYNVSNAAGARTDSANYSLTDNWEFAYDGLPATTGMQAYIEKNWNYISAAGTAWRPFYFILDTTANSSEGGAHWRFIPNDLKDQSTRGGGAPYNESLLLTWPFSSVGLIEGTDTYNDAGFSAFARTSNYDPGSPQIGAKSVLLFDHTSDLSARTFYGLSSVLDLSADVSSSTKSGTIDAIAIPQPAAPDSSGTATAVNGLYVADLGLNRTGMGNGSAILVGSQTTTDGSEGNVKLAGGAYNTGHVEVGSTHLFESAAGTLRTKASAPTSATDGNNVLTAWVATPSNTAVNSVTDVTILSQAVTGLVAGDQVIVDGTATILNDSGSSRTYTVTMDWDSLFDIEQSTAGMTNSASSELVVFLHSVLSIRSTSVAYCTNRMETGAAAGSASGADAAVSGVVPLQLLSWGTTSTDATGSTTFDLKVRSTDATATQTFRLHTLTITKVSP